MNSEHAFIGLQGLSILEGRWSWFLWGSGYQASFEPLVASLFFKLFGPNFCVLQAVPLVAFLGVVTLIFVMLHQTVGRSSAFWLSLLCVFVGRPFIENNVLPYREWSNLFAMLSFFLIWGLCPRSTWRGFCGAFLAFFALYVDFYTLQYLPALALIAYLQLKSLEAKNYLIAGAFVGVLGLAITRFLGPSSGVPISLSGNVLVKNLHLFFGTCFPALLGSGSTASSFFTFLAVSIVALTLYCGAYIHFRVFNPSLRLLGIFGFSLFWTGLLAFVCSPMASDLASSRYLEPLIYALPLTLAPLFNAYPRILKKIVLPYAAVVAVFTWRHSTPFVEKGYLPVRDPELRLESALEMGDFLKRHQIRAVNCDYWSCYQMAFLFRNEIGFFSRQLEPDRNPHVHKLSTPFHVVTPFDRSRLSSDGMVELWRKNGYRLLKE